MLVFPALFSKVPCWGVWRILVERASKTVHVLYMREERQFVRKDLRCRVKYLTEWMHASSLRPSPAVAVVDLAEVANNEATNVRKGSVLDKGRRSLVSRADPF